MGHVLITVAGGTALGLSDAIGRSRVILGTFQGGASVGLLDEHERLRAELRANDSGGALELIQQDSDVSVTVDADGMSAPDLCRSVQILPQLRARYGSRMRESMTSVRFCQARDRCYLDVTNDEAEDSGITRWLSRTDLGGLSGGGTGSPDEPLFSTSAPILDNVRRFVAQCGDAPIARCIDLFAAGEDDETTAGESPGE